MPRFYPVAVEVDGRRYAGDWVLMLGNRVCVRWALGSETAEVGRAKPEVAAVRTLEKMVRADQKRRAKEQRAFGAKRAKLSPNSHG